MPTPDAPAGPPHAPRAASLAAPPAGPAAPPAGPAAPPAGPAAAPVPAAGPPAQPPVGRQLARAAREVARAFDGALARAGGSQPVWLVLIALKTRRLASQRDLAEEVGIREATLTHHLNGMDAQGLITRRRDPGNRRVHLVELTPDGEAAFGRMRRAASGFDERLRAGFSEAELAQLAGMLDRLRGNVAG
jgi:MarR family transcriptional regulator, transcriptional regulator for hemolysin